MTSPVQAFVEARLPFPGLAAWSLRQPNQAPTSQSYVPWLSSLRAEQILHRLVLAAAHLQSHEIEPLRLCWVFEQLRLYLGRGPGRMYLALIVQNAPAVSAASVDGVLKEFENLTP